MTEVTERSQLGIRRRILEEYRKVQTQIATNPKSWRKLSFEAHKELCKVLGDYFIDYPEFEFWFSRFLQGNFELDYDRSLEPKTRLFTDLPVEIFEKIGYSLNLKERFALRNVSKDIQEFVDNWIPRVTDMEVWDSWRIKESFVPSQQVEHYEKYTDNNLVNSTQLQICHLSCGLNQLAMELIMRKFQSPETMVPGFPDLRRFPIHGSNEFYEIEFNSTDFGHIRIERMP